MHFLFFAVTMLMNGPVAHDTFTLATGSVPRVHIETPNGRISIRAGSVSAVRVEVTRRAPTKAALDAITIVHEQAVADAVSVRAVFPSTCDACGSADFVVTVPRGASLELSTNNGPIGITGTDGAITASTNNGAVIGADLGGDVTLQTNNGMVSATYRTIAGVRRIMMQTNNGAVRLQLPGDAKLAHVRAQTNDGAIASDWPLEISHENPAGANTDQHLGDTGITIEISTNKGAIVLIRQRPRGV